MPNGLALALSSESLRISFLFFSLWSSYLARYDSKLI